jgi:hypothetical protein
MRNPLFVEWIVSFAPRAARRLEGRGKISGTRFLCKKPVPEPSGNPAVCAGLIFSRLTGKVPICRVRAPQCVISPPCAAAEWEFSERGSRGNPAKPRGCKRVFPLAVLFLKDIIIPPNGANAIIHCRKAGSYVFSLSPLTS